MEYAFGLPTFSARFFDELTARLRAPSVIVFDRYEELPLRAPLHQWLADALSGTPDGIRVIVTSREEPPGEYARLRASARMDYLGWDDLRLTEEEALGAARRLCQRPDDPATLAVVREAVGRADGWAAGLVLLLEAERTRVRGTPDRALDRERLFEYFASEIFDRADAETRDLLMSSALLPTMFAPALAALTGDTLAERRLAELYRRNYFVTRLGTDPPAFEYHPLFRQFLLARGEETWSSDHVASLRRRAGQALLEPRPNAAAVELLLQGQAWNEAAGAMLQMAPELMSQGRVQVLDGWLQALPPTIIGSMPWLVYWQGICAAGTDPGRAQHGLESAFQSFWREHDATGLYMTFADGVQLAWASGFDFEAVDGWLDRFQQIRASYPQVASEDVEARVLASLLMALYFRNLSHPDLPGWLTRGQVLLDRPLPSPLRGALLSSLGWHYYGRSDFRPWLLRLEGFADEQAPPLYRLHLLASIGYGRLFGGRCAAALEAADEGLRLAGESGVHVLDLMLVGVRIQAALVMQNRAVADAGLNLMSAALAARPNALYRSFECYLRCWRALLDADLATAVDLAQEAVGALETAGAPYSLAATRHALAHALLESGRTAEGWEALQRSHLRSGDHEHQHQAYQCELTEAWLHLHRGDRASASARLEQALARAGAMGFGAPIMARPTFLYPLLQLSLEQGIETNVAKAIIREMALRPPHPAEAPPEWPIPVRVQTLGPFEVAIDRAPPGARVLRKNRPLELLKALIALGGMQVAQEHVSAALWPDAPGDRAIATLHTTLHRLRALLRHDEAVVLADGRVSLNERFVWVDIRAAHGLLDRLDAALVRTPRDDARLDAWQRRLASLGRGRFLELEAERDWMLVARDELTRKVVRVCGMLGRHWEDAGIADRAIDAYELALRFDPCSETLYGSLMRVHADRTDLAAALSVYDRCRAALARELNAAPGPATTALHQSIRQRAVRNR
jgi:DNA-binding SARP family transcriptional activator